MTPPGSGSSAPNPAGGARTALLVPPSGAEHESGPGHPEHPGRLEAVARAVREARGGWEGRVMEEEAAPATVDDLAAVHSRDQIQVVRDAVRTARERRGIVGLDADTRVSAGSWHAALDAAGAAIGAAGLVSDGLAHNAFVAARPPGHHATKERSMGFCLFNNVAVAARWLQRTGRANAVLIVDWDVHHGNGTQDIFYTDPSVCYVSLHQAPHYPGTGAAEEIGSGAGRGTTINVPLPAGLEPDRYRAHFAEALSRAEKVLTPDFVLVSCGFDVLAGDPLGGQMLEPSDLADLTRFVTARSRSWCDGRVAVLLEGGYVPDRVGRGVVEVVQALAEAGDPG